MNILHLSVVKTWGGGGNHIENLCYELSRTSPEDKNIIVVARDGQFEQRLIKSTFNFRTLPLRIKADPRAILGFIRSCHEEKIDIVHIHGSTSLTLAIIAYHLKKLPPFVFSKKTCFPIKERKQTLYKYNHENIKKVLCVSEKTKEIASKSIDQQKLVTIYHGTRVDNKKGLTSFFLREKLKIDQRKKVIGNIANHIPAKSLKTFIAIADHIVNKQKRTDFFFIQIGTFFDETKALKQEITELHLQEHVAFLGHIPEASNFIPQFDISLITSKSEGIPQVIYESFYYRTPVISTNVGGIPEVIENGKNGFLANKYDHKKLAEYVLHLSGNSDLVKKFTERSYQKLMNNFTTKIMAEKTLAEYKKVIDGKS